MTNSFFGLTTEDTEELTVDNVQLTMVVVSKACQLLFVNCLILLCHVYTHIEIERSLSSGEGLGVRSESGK